MIYKQIIRLFSKETAYKIMMSLTWLISKIPGVRHLNKLRLNIRANQETEVFGLKFRNPVGLGPGLDRKGELYNAFTDYGYGFIDVGPFSESTIRPCIEHIQNDPPDEVLSIVINKDHVRAFSLAYDFADMFMFEIAENDILDTMEQILDVRLTNDTYKPVLLRLRRELSPSMLKEVLDFCLLNGVDGFVVGKVENVRKVAEFTKGRVPIVGYGGIRSSQQAEEMFKAGASLIEITTGMVLEGPSLVRKVLRKLP